MITNDVCRECGVCCKRELIDVWDYEYQKILPYLTKPLEKVGDYWQLPPPCPLLGEKGCRLPYKLRPFACRTFPFHFQSFGGEFYFIRYNSKCCPGSLSFRKSPAIEAFLNTIYQKHMKDLGYPVTKKILLI